MLSFILQDGKHICSTDSSHFYAHLHACRRRIKKFCHLSVSTHITAWEPWNRSSWNLMLRSFRRRYWAISVVVKIKRVTLYVKMVCIFACVFYIHKVPRHHMWKTYTRVGTIIVATIYLQLIQNRYMFRSFTSFSVVTSIVYNPLPAMRKS